MAFFYTQKTGCRFEKASFLTGRCRKGRAYQDAGKRQALCQISMIFDLSQINKNDKSEEQSWKKRKYTFYDRYQKVKYANITAEELEVLNISYNKEHYMFDQQHQRNNTVLFCGLESENGCATDFIADSGRDIASDITTEIFFKELFSDLTEKEKKIVSDYFIMGKQVKETAEELGISTRQVSRDKKSALAKMLKRMKAAGYESYAEAAGAFLQESDYIPTQMETQNSIMKKRTGEVRLPSDHKMKK